MWRSSLISRRGRVGDGPGVATHGANLGAVLGVFLGFALALASCKRPAPPPLTVAVYSSVSEPAAQVLLSAVEQRGMARMVRVPIDQADLAWFGDPSEAI